MMSRIFGVWGVESKLFELICWEINCWRFVLVYVLLKTPCTCVFCLSGFQILHIGFPWGIGTSIQHSANITVLYLSYGLSHPGWRQQCQREDEDGQWRVGVSQLVIWKGSLLESSFGRFVSN